MSSSPRTPRNCARFIPTFPRQPSSVPGKANWIAANADSWERFPDDVKTVLKELGREYSRGHAERVKETHEAILQKMADEGATIARLPDEEKARWVEGLPNLAKTWSDQVVAAGLPGPEIMARFMDEARERGAEPLRDWAAGL